MRISILFGCGVFSSCSKVDSEKKVLLVCVDGLRPDAISNMKAGKKLMKESTYSLTAETVYLSVTLPCHMSMFYLVEPGMHGVFSNDYTPYDALGLGITEALEKAGKTSAMFF